MKSLVTLAIFFFMLCSQQAFNQQNYRGLYKSDEVLLPWTKIATPTNYLFVSQTRNNTDLFLKPVLFRDKDTKYTGNSASLSNSDSYATFNGKWESLMGKPIIDTSFYIPTLKIKNNPAYHYSPLYRATATIFNFAVAAKYPYLNAPDK